MGPAPILNQRAFYGKYGNRFGKPGSGAYTRYVGYVHKRRAPMNAAQRGQAPGGGYGYDTGGPLNVTYPTGQTVTSTGTGNPTVTKKPLTLWEQAQALINRAMNPQLQAINSAYDRESQRQSSSIAAATKEYENAVSQFGPAMAQAYQQAQGAQGGTDAALANLLTGKGGEQATNIAGLLGQPAGSEAAQSLQALGREQPRRPSRPAAPISRG